MSTDKDKTTAVTAFPTLSILGIVFIVLKLTDHIDWDWKWVLAPFWIPWVIVLSVFAVIAIVVTLADGLDRRERKKKGIHKDGRRY